MNETWVETTLGDLLHGSEGSIKTGPFGTVLKAAEYSQTGVPLISVGEIGEGFIRVHERTPRVSPDVTDRLAQYLLQCNDIVFARKGSIDRSARVKRHEAGYFLGSDGIRVRLPAGVCPEFIAYQVLTPRVRTWLRQHAGGSTMPSLNQGILERVEILLPPLDEQRRIAGVLGALDDLIETNQRLIASLVNQADAIALQHRLHSAGDVSTFGAVAKVSGGGTPSTKSPEFWGGPICWATPTDMTALPSPYLFGTSRTITQAGLDACSSELFPEGSLLMTSRATIGPSAVTQVPTAVNQGFIVLEPLLDIDRWFLFHELRRRVPEFIARANGSTFMEISRGVFKSLDVEWPDTESRSRLHGWLEPLHAAAATLQREVADLCRTRDELLPLLLSGRVSVREVAA